MDDAFGMGVLDGLADGDEQFEAFTRGELGAVAVGSDRIAPNQFHHEIGAAFGRGSGVEHLRDVRVFHDREGLAFGLESGDHLCAVHARLEHFQGDAAADGVRLLGEEDGAEAALADLFEQAEWSDRSPDDGMRIGSERRRVGGGRAAQKSSGAIESGEKRQDFVSERRIAAGLGLDEGLAVGGGSFESPFEKLACPFAVHPCSL